MPRDEHESRAMSANTTQRATILPFHGDTKCGYTVSAPACGHPPLQPSRGLPPLMRARGARRNENTHTHICASSSVAPAHHKAIPELCRPRSEVKGGGVRS